MLGRVIETEQANAIQGQNNYRFTLETPISEGIYFLRVTSDKGEIHWTNKMLYKNTRP